MVSPEFVYYLQTSIICISILGWMLFTKARNPGSVPAEDKIFCQLLIHSIIFCIADVFAWYSNGKTFPFARATVYISNILYISYMPVMSFLWSAYALYITEKIQLSLKGKKILYAIPSVIFVLLVFSTPITNFAFSVDESNFYHRGFGAYICPAIGWLYIGTISIKLLHRYRRKRSVFSKDTLFMILLFITPAAICTIIQMLVYGTCTIQVGFTMSLLLVYQTQQKNQISQDPLTGLNNRRELDKYFEHAVSSHADEKICICVIDANKFKKINDTYGHAEGDLALKTISSILQAGCSRSEWFLSRFGGDEFVITGINKSVKEITQLRKNIFDRLTEENNSSKKQYKLGLSFGHAEGDIINIRSIESILKIADEDMYLNKLKSRSEKD